MRLSALYSGQNALRLLAVSFVLGFGAWAVIDYRADSAVSVSLAEASQQFGAECKQWDDDGNGCGSSCPTSCKKYSADGNNIYDASCQITSANCSLTACGPNASDGRCGVFENVDQSKCGS